MLAGLLCAALGLGGVVAGPVMAQSATRGSAAGGLFAPVLQVDDRVITGYELDQRTRFDEVLHAPGDPAQEARDRLIDDKLADAGRAPTWASPSPTSRSRTA